jgi:hypothetical protein
VSLFTRLFSPIPDTHWVDQLQPQLEAWTDNSHLYDVAYNLGLDPDVFPPTRAAAMRVPAMSRARNLTCGAIAGLPIQAFRGETLVEPQPYWAYGTDGQIGRLTREQQLAWHLGPQSPMHRHLWTVDDLLFHGESMWIITDRLVTGYPSRMLRLPFDSWEAQSDGTVTDNDAKVIPADDLVWIPGAHEGVLGYGGATLRMAYDLERNAADVAMRPLRLEVHQTSAAEMTPTERKDVVAAVRTAMRSNDGVLFTNNAVELIEHRVDAEALQLGARNASALDVARLANMPALMLDATAQGASLEYQTATGRNQEWIDYGLSLYMNPITARLAMDDISPAGQRVAFETTELTAPIARTTGYPALD